MRLEAGGSAIDRTKPVDFRFDGKPYRGFAGDSVASALLGAGIRVIGRSFKYHRPRGVWGFGVEEPNALFDIRLGQAFEPNARGTTTPLLEGLDIRAVNARPDAASDAYGLIDRVARFLPAGFYYKTFIWPNWKLYEPRIRAMAGLGRIDPDWTPKEFSPQKNVACDVLVIGAGRAGLSSAIEAARAGKSVMLVDEGVEPGGSLLYRESAINGTLPADFLNAALKDLTRLGVTRLADTTAFGIYDHNLVGLCERRGFGAAPVLWRVRPKEIVLATGAIERPLVFPNNDLPGIQSASAALYYLRRHAILPGKKVVIVSNNDSTAETAAAFRAAGAEVQEVATISGVRGKGRVEAYSDGAGRLTDTDAVLVSGGFTPTIHLYAQARGRPEWSEERAAFVPGKPVDGIRVVGSAAGDFRWTVRAEWPERSFTTRAWIDFQNDVTMKDVALAARENFRSVEHLKRYTTLGMATDQGKTSNLNGLAAMAALTGRSIPETGTTTYRPPYTPVSMLAFTGRRHGELFDPLKRLVLEPEHRAEGAVFREYGGWLRPAVYRGSTIEEEAIRARETAGIFDGSSLGKIEVAGPDAAAFLDFNFYGSMSGLKPGRVRYGFLLQESGVVYDDGVVSRIDGNRFVVSCSSAHVAGVRLRFEEWRQDRFDPARVFIHDATPRWATLTVTGPKARKIVEAVGFSVDMGAAFLPHMGFTNGVFEGSLARISRVSFSGDLSFEIAVPVAKARALFAALREVGQRFGAGLLGLEALMILRAEKGYVVVGKDTDGATMPQDLGLSGPRDKRTEEFIGRRSLFTDAALDPARRCLVGLAIDDGEPPLATGAHGIETKAGKTRSIGYVTSSYHSPSLGRPIALALIERGLERMGEMIEIRHLGVTRKSKIVPSCAFDPEGARLNV